MIKNPYPESNRMVSSPEAQAADAARKNKKTMADRNTDSLIRRQSIWPIKSITSVAIATR